jgi:hypothetical protein
MRAIKLTIVMKQKFPVGAMAPLPPSSGRPCVHLRVKQWTKLNRLQLIGT